LFSHSAGSGDQGLRTKDQGQRGPDNVTPWQLWRGAGFDCGGPAALGYKDLIKVTKKTVRWAEAALKQLDDATASDDAALGRLQASQELLRHYIPLAHQVLSQTERRVLRGEKVDAGDKIVSIFEPHTDIIIEGQPQHNA